MLTNNAFCLFASPAGCISMMPLHHSAKLHRNIGMSKNELCFFAIVKKSRLRCIGNSFG